MGGIYKQKMHYFCLYIILSNEKFSMKISTKYVNCYFVEKSIKLVLTKYKN